MYNYRYSIKYFKILKYFKISLCLVSLEYYIKKKKK